jgi:hypothetical protein
MLLRRMMDLGNHSMSRGAHFLNRVQSAESLELSLALTVVDPGGVPDESDARPDIAGQIGLGATWV